MHTKHYPQRYIVTGAAGFIGSRFVEAENAHANIVSVDVKTAFARHDLNFGTMLDIHELAEYLNAESRNSVTAIIHLGACTNTVELDESIHERLNVEYSKMLWTWCAEQRVPFVYASSAATYGDGEMGYDDDEAKIPSLQPLHPYGWSKQKFDSWAISRPSIESPPTWIGLKFFNVYGFGEHHKGRMASMVLHAYEQIKKTGRVRLFRSPVAKPRRDFIFVDDVVDVLRYAASSVRFSGIYNLGTGTARTFEDLVMAVFGAMNESPEIEFIDMPIELQGRYQYFTEAKIDRLRAFGYTKPFTSLEDGVRKYVERLESLSQCNKEKE